MKEKINIAAGIIRAIPLEAWIWIAGLSYFFFINPYIEQRFSLCPLHNLGMDFCPGCGLGRSISFFYHGDIMHSLKAHPLGIAAFFIISHRVFVLIRRNYKLKKGEVYNA